MCLAFTLSIRNTIFSLQDGGCATDEEKQEKELKEAQEGATETQKMSGEALGEDEICRRGRGSQRHKTWGKDKETAGMEEC